MSLNDNEKFNTLIETANKLDDKVVFTNWAQFQPLLTPRPEIRNDPDEEEIEEMEEILERKIPAYYKKDFAWKASIYSILRSRGNKAGIGLSRNFGIPREWRQDYDEDSTELTLENFSEDLFNPQVAIIDFGIENPKQIADIIISNMKLSILLGNIYSEDAKLDVETGEVSDISLENTELVKRYKTEKKKEQKELKEKAKEKKSTELIKSLAIVSLMNPLTLNTQSYKDFILPLMNNIPISDREITLKFGDIIV
jgi:hypothetical protein